MMKRTRLDISLLAIVTAGLIILGSQSRTFTVLEFKVFGWFKKISPKEKREHRLAIVTIGEQDIKHIKHYPLLDSDLAQLLLNIKAKQPAVIGLDIFRDLPIERQELKDVFANTENLVGIDKIIGRKVDPPQILADKDRVAFNDLVFDFDGIVRRSILFADKHEALGARLATNYLKKLHGIEFVPSPENPDKLYLGKAIFSPLTGNEGEYNSDNSFGYQILLNYRGELIEEKKVTDFDTISLTDALENRIPDNLIRDRIVLIGATAQSLKDEVYTPYGDIMPGVVVHANVASQIVSAALDGRPLLQATSKPLNYLWFSLWVVVGVACGVNMVRYWRLVIPCLILSISILLILPYQAFQIGWWIPIVTPIVSLLTAAIATTIWELGRYLRLSYKQLEEYAADLEKKVSDRTLELQQANLELTRLAVLDALTQIPNRRRFDDYLRQEWAHHIRSQHPLSLILIDIDYFKRYNDHYGHQGGDKCLIQVAQAINCVPKRSTDLIARYGGEEFAVILPQTSAVEALNLAEEIRQAVFGLELSHAQSDISPYVTLSLGVASVVPTSEISAESLIAQADKALYDAKRQGRNRVIAI